MSAFCSSRQKIIGIQCENIENWFSRAPAHTISSKEMDATLQAISFTCLKSPKWTNRIMLFTTIMWSLIVTSDYHHHYDYVFVRDYFFLLCLIYFLNWKAVIVWRFVGHCFLVYCATRQICIFSSSLFWCTAGIIILSSYTNMTII